MHNIQKCKCCQPPHFNAVLDDKNPHIRNIRDKLDVSNGLYTIDMWICLHETGPVYKPGTVSGQAAFDKPVRPAALCRGVTTGSEKAGWSEEAELNGVEEVRDEMSDGEEDEIDDEEELAAPDWRVRVGPRNKPTQRDRKEHEATRVPFRDWCVHCMMGRGRTIIMSQNRRVDQSRRPVIAMDDFFFQQFQKNREPALR